MFLLPVLLSTCTNHADHTSTMEVAKEIDEELPEVTKTEVDGEQNEGENTKTGDNDLNAEMEVEQTRAADQSGNGEQDSEKTKPVDETDV